MKSVWDFFECVTAHYSYRSNMDNRLLFQAMAPGYKPFERFHMSKDKVRYYIVYGLAPFFKSLLIEALNKSPYLTVMFDESLNDNIQTNQMDIQVRYWDVSKAITQYMDSKFIARGNACNISTELIQFMKEEVPPKKVVALSMDGPSVNWNVLKVINNSAQKWWCDSRKNSMILTLRLNELMNSTGNIFMRIQPTQICGK